MQTIKPHNDLQLDYKECKNDPFLFGDFVVNFSVFSLIWSISSSVANKHYQPSFSMLLTDHISYLSNIFFSFLAGSVWFWVYSILNPVILRKLSCGRKVQQGNYFWEKRRWDSVLCSPRTFSSTSKAVLFFWTSPSDSLILCPPKKPVLPCEAKQKSSIRVMADRIHVEMSS